MEPEPEPFHLEPISASILANRETERRNATRALGPCKSGCGEVDDYVLMGGFERGTVVGLSADEEGVGLLLGLQFLSKSLCGDPASRALVITPKPAGVLLRSLRDSIAAEVSCSGDVAATDEDVGQSTKRALERVMLSCVFDMEGLQEVLGDLERKTRDISQTLTSQPEGLAALHGIDPSPVSEIRDSDDEDAPLSAEPAASSSNKSTVPSSPDMILITHFSDLLTSLFTQREKTAAHAALHILSSQLRWLSRSLPSHPLILILNSTSASADSSGSLASSKPLDPSLRSVFTPPKLPIPGYVVSQSRPRTKPSFGMVFSQLLDLHLLCSRHLKGAEDATTTTTDEAMRNEDGEATPLVTVVEVLLDELGVWQGKRGPRPSREQRWTAVDVVNGRIVDAFAKKQRVFVGEGRIRTSGGFGGRRP